MSSQNLKYFFLNLEKEWKMLSWLTQTISSKNILSQRRKAIYPAPKSPSPPPACYKKFPRRLGWTGLQQTRKIQTSESARSWVQQPSAPTSTTTTSFSAVTFYQTAELADKWTEHGPTLLMEISDIVFQVLSTSPAGQQASRPRLNNSKATYM